MEFFNNQSGIYSLNKGWRFIEGDFSLLPSSRELEECCDYAHTGGCRGPADAGFDDGVWREVNLPHDWASDKDFDLNQEACHGYRQRGIGWYRVRFLLDQEDQDKHILLKFEGISGKADLYFNGTLLKHSDSSYYGFSVDITDFANFGIVPNTLAVRVDATAWEGWWYEGAGMYRNVWLVKKSAVHIVDQSTFICAKRIAEGSWVVNIETTIANSFDEEKPYSVVTQIIDSENNILGSTESKGDLGGYEGKTISSLVEVSSPKLWDVDDPVLYVAKTTVAGDVDDAYGMVTIDRSIYDSVENIFGFRTSYLEGKNGYWLNSKNCKLKGFAIHQDHAGVGMAVPYSVKEYRMKQLKELGANAVRCAHYPDPEILDICDRIGLLVVYDVRGFCSSGSHMDGLREAVMTARNHPSLILYSIMQEEPLENSSKGRRIAGRMQAVIKNLDDTRQVMGAFDQGILEDEGAASILDVVGINYGMDQYDTFHDRRPEVPVLVSQSAGAFGTRGEYETDQERHVFSQYDEECVPWGNSVRDAWKAVQERKFLAGAFAWSGFDFYGNPAPYTWPTVASSCGALDLCGFEKDFSYFYRAFWKEDPMVHLNAPWTSVDHIGKSIRVMIITNCEEVELLVNGESVGKAETKGYYQAIFVVKDLGGTLTAMGYNNHYQVAKDTLRVPGTPCRLTASKSKEHLLSGGMDAALINYALVDENGTVLGDASDEVRFEVENGTILGVGNGDPNSHEPGHSSQIALFHGKAQLILGNSKDNNVTVTASVKGVEPISVVIPVVRHRSINYVSTVTDRIVGGWKLYKETLKEKPELNSQEQSFAEMDFLPVEFRDGPQTLLNDKYQEYGLYRTDFDFPACSQERSLYFGEIHGKVWVYLDGQEIASRTGMRTGRLHAPLDMGLSGVHCICVIIQNDDEHHPHGGIYRPVTLKEES